MIYIKENKYYLTDSDKRLMEVRATSDNHGGVNFNRTGVITDLDNTFREIKLSDVVKNLEKPKFKEDKIEVEDDSNKFEFNKKQNRFNKSI